MRDAGHLGTSDGWAGECVNDGSSCDDGQLGNLFIVPARSLDMSAQFNMVHSSLLV